MGRSKIRPFTRTTATPNTPPTGVPRPYIPPVAPDRLTPLPTGESLTAAPNIPSTNPTGVYNRPNPFGNPNNPLNLRIPRNEAANYWNPKTGAFQRTVNQPANPYRTTSPQPQTPRSPQPQTSPTSGAARDFLMDFLFTAAAPVGEALGDAYYNQNYQALNPYNPQGPLGRDAILGNFRDRLEGIDQALGGPFELIDAFVEYQYPELIDPEPIGISDVIEGIIDFFAPASADPFLPSPETLDPTDPEPDDPFAHPPNPFDDPEGGPGEPYFIPKPPEPDPPQWPWNPPGTQGGASMPDIPPGRSGQILVTVQHYTWGAARKNIHYRSSYVPGGIGQHTILKPAGEAFEPWINWGLADPGPFNPEGELSYAQWQDAVKEWVFNEWSYPAHNEYPLSWSGIKLQNRHHNASGNWPWWVDIIGIEWVPDAIGPSTTPGTPPYNPLIPSEIPDLAPPEWPLLTPTEIPQLWPPEFPELKPPNPPELSPPELPQTTPPEIENPLFPPFDMTQQRGPQDPPAEPLLEPPLIPPMPPPPDPPTPICRYQDKTHRFDALDAQTALNFAQFKTVTDRLGPQITGGLSTYITKISDLTRKTWDFLQLDRVLALMTYITSLHNAYMLSTNIVQTLFSGINNVLYVIGIEDADGNPLDIGAMISQFTEGFAKTLFGAQRLDKIKAEWAALNRIYQTGMNIIYTMQSVVDSLRSMLEIIGEYISKIGNALKRSGAIMENSFGWMQERFDKFSVGQNRWEKMFTRLEQVDNVASSMEMVTSEARSIKDEVNNIKQDREAFKQAIAEYGELNQAATDDTGTTPESVNIAQTEATNAAESQAPETLNDPMIGFPEEEV